MIVHVRNSTLPCTHTHTLSVPLYGTMAMRLTATTDDTGHPPNSAGRIYSLQTVQHVSGAKLGCPDNWMINTKTRPLQSALQIFNFDPFPCWGNICRIPQDRTSPHPMSSKKGTAAPSPSSCDASPARGGGESARFFGWVKHWRGYPATPNFAGNTGNSCGKNVEK